MRLLYISLAGLAIGLGGFIWFQEGDFSRTEMMERPLPTLERTTADLRPLLGPCSVCGKEVSRSAKACPHCGETDPRN